MGSRTKHKNQTQEKKGSVETMNNTNNSKTNEGVNQMKMNLKYVDVYSTKTPGRLTEVNGKTKKKEEI